jgi:Fic family protein
MLFSMPDLEEQDLEVIDAVLELRRQLRYALAVRTRWSGVLRRVTMAQAIRSSNSIEGYRVSAEDALAAVDDGAPIEAEEDDVAWAATVAYQRAMTYVLHLHDDPHFEYAPTLLRSLHFMLVEYDLEALPGRWRPGAVFVNDTSSGEVVYEGPPSNDVPALIDELVTDLGQGDGQGLVKAAMAHLNLVMIHPFRDGNGRMARVLQSLVLAREGILAPEFCSIEEYLGRHTRDYYDVLADVGGGQWQPNRTATPWVRFCLTAHARQARVLHRRTIEFGELYEWIDSEIDNRGLPERSAGALFLAAFGYRITNETYRNEADTTPATATRDLRALTESGLLEAHGEKRGRWYAATPDLRERSQRVVQRVREAARFDPYEDPALMADPYAQPTLNV